MPKGIPKRNGIHHASEDFVKALIELGKIEELEVFYILDSEARKQGYSLAARQLGIRGTSILFVPSR